MIKEDFLHYLWKFKKFGTVNFSSIDNKPIEIIDFGLHNLNSGPDFTNAKIKFNEIVFVGNIEIHINSSDWYKHKHQFNSAYNNVILHIVYNNDKDVFIKNKKLLTIEIKSLIPKIEIDKFKNLFNNQNTILCNKSIPSLTKLDWLVQLDSMSINRLRRKLDENSRLLDEIQGNYSKLFDILVGKILGGPVNKDAFEIFIENYPRNIESKLESNSECFKDFFLGLAGFYTDNKNWKYYSNLHNLKPISKEIWKYGRLLPAGFPEIRLKQFSNILRLKPAIISLLFDTPNSKELIQLIQSNNKSNIDLQCNISKEMSKKLIVNAFLPFIEVMKYRKYNKINFNYSFKILQEIKNENNSIIKKWQKIGYKCDTMYKSQALIELYNEFCAKKQCLNCKFGIKFMAQ